MKIKSSVNLLISAILVAYINSRLTAILCNPLAAYDPSLTPLIALPQLPLQAPLLMSGSPHYGDPFAASMPQGQYILAPPSSFGAPFMAPFDFLGTNRRSVPGIINNEKSNKPLDPMEREEQKALGDLPVSFVDPDPPSSISERLSDSFSALGEGVRNHFRSMSENFADTLDDLKDAWRSSDNEKKRG